MWFLINAAFCALNVGIYAMTGGAWYNLAAGIFSGLVALYCLAADLS